jgi:hypothetical protein
LSRAAKHWRLSGGLPATNQSFFNDMTTDLKTPQTADGVKPDYKEGKVMKAIEQTSASLPTDIFLWLALGSIGLSVSYKLRGKNAEALFVGQWPAPFLIMGLYSKLVKLQGSDKV